MNKMKCDTSFQGRKEAFIHVFLAMRRAYKWALPYTVFQPHTSKLYARKVFVASGDMRKAFGIYSKYCMICKDIRPEFDCELYCKITKNGREYETIVRHRSYAW
uniref:Cell division control protein 6 homolog B-like n=1 Tax=Tanacetum cinerariifolium TaxID=118510 RepID=A0A6L2NSV6_TANCI|nr:cell division control protein 6 homolog B-like [Tanacetum cinerariifolium]